MLCTYSNNEVGTQSYKFYRKARNFFLFVPIFDRRVECESDSLMNRSKTKKIWVGGGALSRS